jgi:hypothetical protein
MNLRTSPEPEWPGFVDGWRTLGATHIGLKAMGAGLKSAAEHLHMLEEFITLKQDSA